MFLPCSHTLEKRLPYFYFKRIEQAEIVTFQQKVLEAPSVVKMEQKPKERSTQLSKGCVDFIKDNLHC